MFSTLTQWSLCFATIALLTACGGGDHTDTMQPSNAPLASTSHSIGVNGGTLPGANGTASAADALEQPQVLTAATIESTTVTMHGASAAILPATTVASQQERLLFEQGQIDYERSFSIEMNRRHEEQLAREKAGEAALQDDAAIGAECQQAYAVTCPKIGG